MCSAKSVTWKFKLCRRNHVILWENTKLSKNKCSGGKLQCLWNPVFSIPIHHRGVNKVYIFIWITAHQFCVLTVCLCTCVTVQHIHTFLPSFDRTVERNNVEHIVAVRCVKDSITAIWRRRSATISVATPPPKPKSPVCVTHTHTLALNHQYVSHTHWLKITSMCHTH